MDYTAKYAKEFQNDQYLSFTSLSFLYDFQGQDYLLPKDTPDMEHLNLKKNTFNIQDLYNNLADQEPFVLIFVMDCSREHYPRSPDLGEDDADCNDSRSTKFNFMSNGGSLVAFSCAPGAVPIEHKWRRNTLFTKHLVQYIKAPIEDIGSTLAAVNRRVTTASKDQQMPILYDELVEKNIFLRNQSQGN